MDLTQPIKWHGGKHYLAKRIIALMPEHTHYVEPYFGGGSVLLQKPNYLNVSEVVNDINLHLTRFWRALQDPADFDEFMRRVEATPFSEIEYDAAQEELADKQEPWSLTEAIMQDAVAFFIVARQSRQGLMKDFATLSRNRTRRGMNEQVSSWLTAIEGLPDVHARLKRVVILNREAVDVIRSQDGPKTLFYCDPPYLHETRVTTSDYQHEMSESDHRGLLNALGCIQGKFILSGYPSSVYDEKAKMHGWHRVDIEIDNKASSKKVKDRKVECLWMNYEPEMEQ